MSKVVFKAASDAQRAAAKSRKSSFVQNSAFTDGSEWEILAYDEHENWVVSDDSAEAACPVLRVKNGTRVENLFLSTIVRPIQDYTTNESPDIERKGTFNAKVVECGANVANDEEWLKAIISSVRTIVAKRGSSYRNKYGNKARVLDFNIK